MPYFCRRSCRNALKIFLRFHRLRAPLEERRRNLERKKEAFQFLRDVEDEKLWIADRMPLARSPLVGDSLYDCHNLQKKNQV